MRKCLALFWMCALLGPAGAEYFTPRPYSGGDYWLRIEQPWLDWEVTCPELAGRLTPSWPTNDEEPGALLEIDWAVSRWPVIRKFAKGDHIKARPDSVGGTMIKDLDGSSWMRVQLEDGRMCFVRANSRYLRPLEPALAAPSPLPESPPTTP